MEVREHQLVGKKVLNKLPREVSIGLKGSSVGINWCSGFAPFRINFNLAKVNQLWGFLHVLNMSPARPALVFSFAACGNPLAWLRAARARAKRSENRTTPLWKERTTVQMPSGFFGHRKSQRTNHWNLQGANRVKARSRFSAKPHPNCYPQARRL